MLTSIYYYGYYKPYLYSTEKTPREKKIGKASSEGISRFRGIDAKDYAHNNSENSSYVLNYSDRKEVKSMISGISDNVNGIKDTVHYLLNAKRGRNARLDNGKSAYGDGLEDFASDLNELNKFTQGKGVSEDIKAFGAHVNKVAAENSDLLAKVGVTFNGDTAEFDRGVYDSLSSEEYAQKSVEVNEALTKIYDDAVDVLKKPLSQHLNFKNLDYYYNYSYSSKSKEPLGFVDTGLVVDIML